MPQRPKSAGRQAKKRLIPGEQYLTRRPESDDWQININIEGSRFRRSCGTANKAQAAALAVKEYDRLFREIVLGERPILHMTLNEAGVQWYQEIGKDTTYGQRAQRHQIATMIEILGKTFRLADLNDAVVNDLVQTLRRRRIVPHNVANPDAGLAERRIFSPATVNRYLMTLSTICKRAREIWQVEVGTWTVGKHRATEARGREVFLEMEQARALWAAAVAHLKPILFLELTTGLRSANVHDLAWEQVSLPTARLVMIQKGGKPHAVDLVPDAVMLLERLQPAPEKRKGPVFWFGNPAVGCECAACKSPAKKGRGIGSTKRAFATATRAAGLDALGLRFHDLRHTLASWLLDQTGDLKLVQEQLGHRNIQTTARYAHLTGGRKAAAVASATAGLLLEAPAGMEKKKAS